MDDESFQRLPTGTRREFSHQTWHNSIAEESWIVRRAFWNINKTVDPVNGP
jgi:hypothetical protein